MITSQAFKALLVGIALVAGSSVATAQIKPVGIGYVDLERVLITSAAGKELQKVAGEQEQAHRERLQGHEQSVEEARQELERQRAVLTPEAFRSAAEEKEKALGETYRVIMTRAQGVAEAISTGRDTLVDTIRTITTEQAKKAGATVVLPARPFVALDPALDLTDEVLALVDQQLPSVKVSLPAGN